MQSFIPIFIILLCWGQSQAQSSSIVLQNNTDLEFNINAIQFGTHIMNSNEWSQKVTTVAPWENEVELLETNRNSGVHNGETFYFEVFVSHGLDTFVCQLKLDGNFFASSLDYSLRGAGFDDAWFDNDGFHSQNITLAGRPMTLKYRPDGNDLTFNRDIIFAIQDNTPRYTIDTADVSNPNVLNVLSYNIKFLPPPVGSLDADDRADVIPRYIDPSEDVVIFQEAFEGGPRNDHLTPAMQAAGFIHRTSILNGGQAITNGGVVIYSKWPIEADVDYDYKNCDNNSGDCLAAKGVKYAKINKLGKYYHVFGTHMEAGGNANDIAIKKEQLGEQRDFIAAQNIPANEAVIIGGDMNTSVLSSHYTAVLDSLNPVMGPHRGFYSSKSVFGDTSSIIDHLWSDRNHLIPTDMYTEIWILRAIDDEVWEIFNPSDHLPVHARFEFPDADTPAVIQNTICSNSVGNLSFSVADHPHLTYQWYLNGTAIVGADQSTYTNVAPTVADTGTYSCVIQNQFIVRDTGFLAHYHWPDTTNQQFDFEVAEVDYVTLNNNPSITQSNDTLFSDASVGNQWYLDGVAINGANDSILVISQNGNYTTIVRQGICTSMTSNSIMYTALTELLATDLFKLYPNPVSNTLTIETEEWMTYDIQIIAANGQEVFYGTTQDSKTKITIPTLENGLYWCRVITKEGIWVKTFQVQK